MKRNLEHNLKNVLDTYKGALSTEQNDSNREVDRRACLVYIDIIQEDLNEMKKVMKTIKKLKIS